MRRNLFLLLILTAITLIPSTASADEKIRCESNGRRRTCSYATRGRPTLLHQLSSASCIKGETWGFDDAAIWVDRGCRADFLIEERHEREDSTRDDVTIVCESSGRRHRCEVDVPYGVRLTRQLGRRDCIRGTTWGSDSAGIWVTDGCRGEFLVEGTDRRREGDGEGRDRDYDRDRDRDRRDGDDWKRDPHHFRIVTCESKDNHRNLCRTDTRYGVDIRKQLSISECRFKDTWGYDVDGIWVKEGCRAEFFVRVP